MVRWESIYESQQNDDPSFITRVLFSIEAMVKTYLVSRQSANDMSDMDEGILCSSCSQEKIQQLEFIWKIPEVLHLKLDSTSPPEGGNEENPFFTYQGQDFQDKEKQVFSSNPKYCKCLLQDGESYVNVFHLCAHLCPKDNNCLLCMIFFIKGKCKKGCPH